MTSMGVNIRGLADVRLTEQERASLARQGFVATELRGQGRPCFKLRFRSAGRQRVRYLGKDPQTARAIARELVGLQAARRVQLRLRRLSHQARLRLRQAKQALQPLL